MHASACGNTATVQIMLADNGVKVNMQSKVCHPATARMVRLHLFVMVVFDCVERPASTNLNTPLG